MFAFRGLFLCVCGLIFFLLKILVFVALIFLSLSFLVVGLCGLFLAFSYLFVASGVFLVEGVVIFRFLFSFAVVSVCGVSIFFQLLVAGIDSDVDSSTIRRNYVSARAAANFDFRSVSE